MESSEVEGHGRIGDEEEGLKKRDWGGLGRCGSKEEEIQKRREGTGEKG